jgi:thiamine-phosphate pyrophosphorylase
LAAFPDLFPAVRVPPGVGSVAVVRALVNAPDPEAAPSICCKRMQAAVLTHLLQTQ